MSENKKPRICEVLGVEVNERFSLPNMGGEELRISSNGHLCGANYGYVKLICEAINHPEKIKRKPRWTEDDIADAKAVRRLWPEAWSVKHGRAYMDIFDSNGALIAYLDKKIFQSIQLGESVDLDVILEAGE